MYIGFTVDFTIIVLLENVILHLTCKSLHYKVKLFIQYIYDN